MKTGERRVDFCLNNGCLIGGTMSPPKNIHKLTWRSPGGTIVNQIDHFIVNSKKRRSLQDVRTYRGADANSDHYLVGATIKLKLRRAVPQGKHRKQLDTTKLKCPNINKEFVLELRNRFSVLSTRQLRKKTMTLTVNGIIVNRGKWLGSLAKFFVLCFCSLFWP